MHVTPSLKESYVVACDLPVPALTYIQRGHHVVIAVDQQAITAFRRDAAGKTPLDRTEILPEDLDDLPSFLAVGRSDVPKNFGDLYRILVSKGAVLVADEATVRAQGIDSAELDPVLKVISSDEFRKIITDNDTLLPYDEIGMPHHSLFGADHH
jgi:predicted peroxiredoxin